MARNGGRSMAFMAVLACSLALIVAAAEEKPATSPPPPSSRKGSKTYTHIWPEMELGWRVVVGTLMAFCGAAFGSVGGVGGGGIFVPMLTLVIGFDTKSSAAISKCMIVGAAGSTVYYNIKQRHPTLDMPIIDYDLALLFQPMLVLGISIGVTLNVILSDWMVNVLLIILFLVTSTKAFFKGIEIWKKETVQKKAVQTVEPTDGSRASEVADDIEAEGQTLPEEPKTNPKVPFMKNVHWKKLGVIVSVWIAILALQVIKSYTRTCSPLYWILNSLQVPISVAASGYEAVMLYKGKRVIASRGSGRSKLKARQLIFYCFTGVMAGTIGGLLGIGGGTIMGPLFLEMGIPPQVSSATATFAMLFSSSMSVVEYYLIKRFPIPYTLYFVGVTTIAALVGQYAVKKVIKVLGRASLIIFVLALTIFISAFLMGGEGTANMVHKIEHHEYLWFESLCAN